MAGKSAALTVNVVADASKAVKAFSATGDAGKAMATQLNLAADRMERDLENTKKIAEKLATALGPKFKTTVGDNIDDIAAQFNRAGLKIEDVEKNLPDLVRGLKRVEDQADDTADQMTRIGHETDKTGSVMANFAGNAVQEIPGISEAFGPLNTAIGQFAEYATEGDINIKNLVTSGLGMAGVGVAMMGVNYILSQMAEEERKAKEQAQGRLDVYNALSDKKYEDAAQSLYDTYKDTYSLYAKIGVSTTDLTKILTGDQSAIDKYRGKIKAYATQLVDIKIAQGNISHDQRETWITTYVDKYTNGLYDLAGAYDGTVLSADKTKVLLQDIGAALGATTTKTEQLATANKDAANAVWDFYDAQLGLINLQLGKRGAERNYRRALEEYNKINADGTATEDQKAEALDNVESAALQLAQATGDLAAESGGAAAGAQAQIDVLKGLASYMAPGSELRNNLQGYVDDLRKAANVEFVLAEIERFRSSGGRGYPANYLSLMMSRLGQLGYTGDVEGYATGTMNAARGLALVGENGPELIDFGGGERVYTAQQTSAMLDGGGTTIHVNLPAGADGDDVVRALQKWVRRNGQLPLPVSSKTIR